DHGNAADEGVTDKGEQGQRVGHPERGLGESRQVDGNADSGPEPEPDRDLRVELHPESDSVDGQRNAAKLEPRAVSEQAGLGDPSRAGRSRKWPVRALRHAWAAAAFLHLAACAPDGGVDPSATATDSAAVPPRHTRELIFAGQRGAEPLVSVLAFSTTDD